MKELQNQLNYTFKDIRYLRLALTHPSTKQPDNQRLEFLGDAILAFCVSDMLYRKYPKYREGALTARRAALVCERTLATIALSLSLGEYIILGNGEDMTGGRQKPAILADAMEAVLAAVFIDGGIEEVKRVVLGLYANADNLIHADAIDDKSALQEFTQAHSLGLPKYSIIETHGPDHNRQFVAQVSIQDKPIATGEGLSKKSAEQAAAKTALMHYKQAKGTRNETNKA